MEEIIVAVIVCVCAYYAGRKLLRPALKSKSGCNCSVSDHCGSSCSDEEDVR